MDNLKQKWTSEVQGCFTPFSRGPTHPQSMNFRTRGAGFSSDKRNQSSIGKGVFLYQSQNDSNKPVVLRDSPSCLDRNAQTQPEPVAQPIRCCLVFEPWFRNLYVTLLQEIDQKCIFGGYFSGIPIKSYTYRALGHSFQQQVGGAFTASAM